MRFLVIWSDSVGEMALISAALKSGPKVDSLQPTSPRTSAGHVEEKSPETDHSSQDITLSEVGEQSLDSASKRKGKPKRQQQR